MTVMRTVLSVNLNKVALLRNQRDLDLPSVVRTAKICLDAGAHGLTIHPRPDERHARPHDAHDLKALIEDERRSRHASRPAGTHLELNIEGNPTPAFVALVRAVRPDQCTLVPDAPDARTSDNGWDVIAHGEHLTRIVSILHDDGVRVSVFMNPDLEQIDRVPATGADRIELYTEPYAKAHANAAATAQAVAQADSVARTYTDAARKAQGLGLGVNAGHDLNLHNLAHFCSVVPGVLEVSIGHALTADALEMGWTNAIHAYLRAIESADGARR
jgi:pyridoxine 5-phosphate synthase